MRQVASGESPIRREGHGLVVQRANPLLTPCGARTFDAMTPASM